MNRLAIILYILFFSSISNVQCQESFTTRPSPLALTAIRFKDAYVKVVYSQPQKKGREIFGRLVPYGQVWRTGANEATEITITRDILVSGQLLKAGTYSLFTIPDKEKWSVIFNTDLGLWGAYNYNPKLDAMKIDVPVQTNETLIDAFTIVLEQKNDVADLLMIWDNVKVSVPLKFIN